MTGHFTAGRPGTKGTGRTNERAGDRVRCARTHGERAAGRQRADERPLLGGELTSFFLNRRTILSVCCEQGKSYICEKKTFGREIWRTAHVLDMFAAHVMFSDKWTQARRGRGNTSGGWLAHERWGCDTLALGNVQTQLAPPRKDSAKNKKHLKKLVRSLLFSSICSLARCMQKGEKHASPSSNHGPLALALSNLPRSRPLAHLLSSCSPSQDER